MLKYREIADELFSYFPESNCIQIWAHDRGLQWENGAYSHDSKNIYIRPVTSYCDYESEKDLSGVFEYSYTTNSFKKLEVHEDPFLFDNPAKVIELASYLHGLSDLGDRGICICKRRNGYIFERTEPVKKEYWLEDFEDDDEEEDDYEEGEDANESNPS